MDDQELFKVTCPHCRALLEIDPRNKLVVGGEAPPAPKEGLSFDERLKKLEEDKKNAQSKFEESVRAEKARRKCWKRSSGSFRKRRKIARICP